MFKTKIYHGGDTQNKLSKGKSLGKSTHRHVEISQVFCF